MIDFLNGAEDLASRREICALVEIAFDPARPTKAAVAAHAPVRRLHGLASRHVRIPMKPAVHSKLKPATHSDFIPADVPI